MVDNLSAYLIGELHLIDGPRFKLMNHRNRSDIINTNLDQNNALALMNFIDRQPDADDPKQHIKFEDDFSSNAPALGYPPKLSTSCSVDYLRIIFLSLERE